MSVIKPMLVAMAILAVAAGLKYEAPDYCSWVLEDADSTRVALSCKLRTISNEFEKNNFSVLQAEHTVKLNIECSDVLFFESTLNPNSFQNLHQLEDLLIEFCKIRQVPAGAFEGLRGLKRLTLRTHNSDWSAMTLELNSESFTGLRELQSLDLADNNIWTVPNGTFCGLHNLQTLNVTGNRLQDVTDLNFRQSEGEVSAPRECFLDLKTLDVSWNALPSLPPHGFAKLRRVQTLHLQHNEISSLADGALEGLASLRFLNMSSNRLVALPSDLFSSCRNLQELDLHNNSVSRIAPGLLDGLDQLLVLDLSMNDLVSDWVGEQSFKGLIRLIVLNLSFNSLTKLDAVTFRDLYSLQILNLKGNAIQIIDDNAFLPLYNLHTLVLSHNSLIHIDALLFNGLFVLSKLFLNNNEIKSMNHQAFRNCSNLQELSLNGNFLSEVPVTLRDLPFLKTLDLGENQLELKNGSFYNLQQLHGLRLIDNNIGNLTKGIFWDLPSLQVLNLAKNKIQSIEQGTFDRNEQLEAIRLDANFLTDINGVFTTLPRLMWLNISDNHLQWFDYAFIPKSLEWMYMQNNYVEELGNYFSIQDELKLRTLDASYNRIREINAMSITNNIELLLINNNYISHVPANTFLDKLNLTRVDMYANELQWLELSSLRLSPVSVNKSLPEFYIGGNPFQCDCDMEWLLSINQMSHMRQHPRVMDLDNIMCKMTYSRGQVHIPLTDARPSNFLCTYEAHCFALCHCCDFDACDCEMTCPRNCTCYHDQTWSANIVDCSGLHNDQIPQRIPMDATEVYLDGNNLKVLLNHVFIGRKNMKVLFVNSSRVEVIQNQTFNGLNALQALHLEDNFITRLTGLEFDHLNNLRELYLQNNRISFVSNITLLPLRSLEVLRLEGNRIVTFPVWQITLNSYLIEVTLSNNRWSCECHYLMKLQTWIQDNTRKVVDGADIRCYYNTTRALGPVFSEWNATCGNSGSGSGLRDLLGADYFPMVVASISALLIVTIISVLLFVYRHDVRVWLHSHYGLRLFHAAPIDDAEKLYDAYVCYSPKDEELVTHTLAAELEHGNPSYRLYLQHRDLPEVARGAGAVEAAEASRRLLVVLSRNFLQTEWSRYEFRSVVHESLKGRKGRLILVLEGDVGESELDPDMRLYFKTSARVRWGEKRFWEKLRYALPSEPQFRKNLRHYSRDGTCPVKMDLKKEEPRFWPNYASSPGPPLPPPRSESGIPITTLRYPHTYTSIDPSDSDNIYTAIQSHYAPPDVSLPADAWRCQRSSIRKSSRGQTYLV